MRVLVLGCGVIGAACAYFLTRRGIETILLERAAPACAASGKAGGFLALDWSEGAPRGPLSRRSFALHRELARKAGEELGYRPVETLLVAQAADGAPAPWLDRRFRVLERLGGPETTALVDPARLTRYLLAAATDAGARLVIDAVRGIDEAGQGWHVHLTQETLAAEAVILALGPWTNRARAWLPLPPVAALLGHSLRLDLAEPLAPRVLFVRLDPRRFGLGEFELYPRTDGSVIIAGLSRPATLPADPTEVRPDPGAGERLLAAARAVLPALAAASRIEARACLRPMSLDGTPLIGPVPGRPGLWLASAHGPWGILDSLATGELMADLLTGAEPKIDPRPFDPARPSARL